MASVSFAPVFFLMLFTCFFLFTFELVGWFLFALLGFAKEIRGWFGWGRLSKAWPACGRGKSDKFRSSAELT